jgi:hypothetical protein
VEPIACGARPTPATPGWECRGNYTNAGDASATEAKRLKELEQENSRLKRLLADAELDKAMLKELVAP